MSLSALIVHYSDPGATQEAVSSLLAGLLCPDEIIVVDHSPEGESKLKLPATVQVIRNAANPGFAAGVNRAAGEASPDNDLYLLNPDARVAPETLQFISQFMKEHQELGAATLPIDHDPPGELAWFSGGRIRPLLGGIRHLQVRAPDGSTDFLCGASMWIRRQCWNETGEMESSFFLYGEDVDWCTRARGQGWELSIIDDLGERDRRIRHVVSASILSDKDGAARKSYYIARNTVRLLRQRAALLMLLPIAIPRLLWIGMRQSERGAWMRGLWHGLRGHTGVWAA